MKWWRDILVIMSILVLVSCSAQKSSTKLQISVGMINTTNTTYAGGMVYYGRSTSGEVFSLPVAYNEDAQVEIDLTKGTWTIGAVGWTTTKMSGTSKCAVKENINIDTDQKTIQLTLDLASCEKSEFGTNRDDSHTFGKPILVTCGTFYNDTKTDPSNPSFLGGDNPDYCSGPGSMIEPEFKIHARSAVIGLPTLIPGQKPSLNNSLSVCVDLEQGWINGLVDYLTSNSVNIPLKGLPLKMELYNEKCGNSNKEKMTEYFFDRGLEDIKYGNFDHLVFEQSIYLLASMSQRGSSYFVKNNFFPRFKCDSSDDRLPCLKIPTIEAGSDRFVQSHRYFYVKDKVTGESCDNYAGKTIDDNLPPNSLSMSRFAQDCIEHDGKFFVQLPAPLVASCSGRICFSATFKSGGTPTDLTLKLQDTGSSELAAYDLLFRTVGYEEFTYDPANNSQLSNAIDSILPLRFDNWHGSLGEVRQILAPDSLGGLIANASNPSGATFSIPLNTWDHGAWKKFIITSKQLSTSDATRRLAIPKYLVTKDNPGDTSTNDYYNRKIEFAEVLDPPLANRTIYNILYKNGKQLGMMEAFHLNENKENHTSKTERSLIYWNTESETNNRFEHYRYEQEIDSDNGDILRTHTSFIRAERDDQDMDTNSNITGGNLRLEEYRFDSNFNSISNYYEETGTKHLLQLKNNKAYMAIQNFNVKDKYMSHLNYFTDPYTEDFRNSSRLLSEEKEATTKSPDGSYIVRAWSVYDGSKYDLKILTKKRGSAATIETLDVNSLDPITAKLTSNNAGQAMVAFVKKTTLSPLAFNLFALVRTWDGTSWYWEDSGGSGDTPSVFNSDNDILESNANDIAFDIIDQNPRSTSCSSKTILFFDNTSVTTSTGTTKFTNSLTYNMICALNEATTQWWGSITNFYSNMDVPTKIEIIKDADTYYVIWLSSAPSRIISTTDFSSRSEINTFSPPAGTAQATIVKNGTSLDLVLITNNGNFYNLPNITSDITPAPLLTLETEYLYNQPALTCFSRGVSTSEPLGQSQFCQGEMVETSFADPIKLNFNFDIETLNPSNFVDIFNLNK